MQSPVLRSNFTIPGDKNEKTYNYGFCVDQEGVTEEWLNSKAKTARKYSTVFYRGNSDSELDLSGLPKNSRGNIKIALENAGADYFSRS